MLQCRIHHVKCCDAKSCSSLAGHQRAWPRQRRVRRDPHRGGARFRSGSASALRPAAPGLARTPRCAAKGIRRGKLPDFLPDTRKQERRSGAWRRSRRTCSTAASNSPATADGINALTPIVLAVRRSTGPWGRVTRSGRALSRAATIRNRRGPRPLGTRDDSATGVHSTAGQPARVQTFGWYRLSARQRAEA